MSEKQSSRKYPFLTRHQEAQQPAGDPPAERHRRAGVCAPPNPASLAGRLRRLRSSRQHAGSSNTERPLQDVYMTRRVLLTRDLSPHSVQTPGFGSQCPEHLPLLIFPARSYQRRISQESYAASQNPSMLRCPKSENLSPDICK